MSSRILFTTIAILGAVFFAAAPSVLAKTPAKKKKTVRLKPLAPLVLLYDAETPKQRPRVLTFGRLPDTVSDAPILLDRKNGKPQAQPAMTDEAAAE